MQNSGLMESKISNPKVFVPMACDLIHEGHINILKKSKKLGHVIVGLLTDEAINVYKPLPIFNYARRKEIISSIKYVDEIYKTKNWDYSRALEDIKPEFVVHGDDWKENNQVRVRQNVINQIKKWKGKLVELPYTKGISSTSVKDVLRSNINPIFLRTQIFSRLIKSKNLIRVIEVHNGLSALVADRTKFKNKEFDCLWLSSLTHSASKGKPDIEYIDDTTVNSTINDIFEITLKPLIFDADSGGRIEHLKYSISNLGRLGVSAAIIEDKIGSKKNSLSKKNNTQKQDSITNFKRKLIEVKKVSSQNGVFIFARIESLILGKGLDDAIKRAKNYINAGADGIMIHSKKQTPKEIFDFCKLYNNLVNRKPLVVVPSTFHKTYEKDFYNHGANIVIYANHLLRASIPAMEKVAKSILEFERSSEVESEMKKIDDLLDFTDK